MCVHMSLQAPCNLVAIQEVVFLGWVSYKAFICCENHPQYPHLASAQVGKGSPPRQQLLANRRNIEHVWLLLLFMLHVSRRTYIIDGHMSMLSWVGPCFLAGSLSHYS
jgi:hypothetical protein